MYTDRHQMFQTMYQLAKSAQSEAVTVKCDNAHQAIYVQRVFYEFKRTSTDVVYDTFNSVRTKRKGMTVWFLPKTYSLDPITNALGISTVADKAQVVVSKALSNHNIGEVDQVVGRDELHNLIDNRLDELNGDQVKPKKAKRPFVRHAGHFVKGDPRLCKDKGLVKGGQEPSDRIWSYLEKRQGQTFDEVVLRKEISHTKLSYDLVKFDTGLKWLADNGFITIEGNAGKRRIRTRV